MDLYQDVMHFFVGALFRNGDAQFIADVFAHCETCCTGSILLVRKGIQNTIEFAGIQVIRVDDFFCALTILLKQVIQRIRPVVVDDRIELTVDVVVAQKIDRFTGGKRQVDLLTILSTNKFDLDTDLFTSDLADCFCYFSAVRGISIADTPQHKFDIVSRLRRSRFVGCRSSIAAAFIVCLSVSTLRARYEPG